MKSYSEAEINELILKAQNCQTNYYGNTDTCLYSALDDFPIVDKTVVVYGSRIPWYEAICLARGAHPITIDYNIPLYNHPGIVTLNNDEELAEPIACAFSISSFEHDGLGRYGDPINPDGDLVAMKNLLKKMDLHGKLYLSVPVGYDGVEGNRHRIYGTERLPLLLKGWTTLKAYGMPKVLHGAGKGLKSRQPILVLTQEE